MLSSRLLTTASPILKSRNPSIKNSFPSSRRCLTVMAASKKVLVPIGTGSEEMEAVITIDVLRRAGADVTVASVEGSLEVNCSRHVKILADKVRET